MKPLLLSQNDCLISHDKRNTNASIQRKWIYYSIIQK